MSQPVPIPGYEGRYDIHPDGRVWSHHGKGKFRKNSINCRSGYVTIGLTKNQVTKGFLVHRLLAIAYIPNPEGKGFVDHIDHDRTNNSLDNLRWLTRQENNQNYKLQKRNKTGVQGVNYTAGLRKPWHARLTINCKQHVDYFATKEEAIAQRKAWELQYFI